MHLKLSAISFWRRTCLPYIDPRMLILAVLLLLTMPLRWLLAALFAAAFHEFCHFLAIKILNVPFYGIKIGVFRAQIEAAPTGNKEEFLITVAGPLGSMLLFLLFRWIPRIAIFAGIQMLFNLLPLYPLDGGRLLRIALETICPRFRITVERWTRNAVFMAATAAAVYLSIVCSLGIVPVLLSAVWIIKVFQRKIPCKQGQNRVQ